MASHYFTCLAGGETQPDPDCLANFGSRGEGVELMTAIGYRIWEARLDRQETQLCHLMPFCGSRRAAFECVCRFEGSG